MNRSASSHVVTLFGSSRPREGDELYRLAFECGTLLAQNGYTICNGGYGGTMEASARGAREAGGRTIGVVCERFGPVANRFTDRTIVCGTLMERLTKLIALGDAYIVFPGSTGTLLELAAVWEMENKSIISTRPLLLIGSFWNDVVRTLDAERSFEGNDPATSYITIVPDPISCLPILSNSLNSVDPSGH